MPASARCERRLALNHNRWFAHPPLDADTASAKPGTYAGYGRLDSPAECPSIIDSRDRACETDKGRQQEYRQYRPKKRSDAWHLIAAGEVDWTKQPLFGVPISVKDNIEVAGMPTRCGAPGLRDNIAREDATVVRRLKDAGAIVVAKARLPFMAIWYESQNAFGCACNPYDLDRTAGGSSGGDGALVAAGAVPLGVGQDGNGSIRVPSHCCGIAGLAPALGRVSIAGLYPPTENWEKAFCHKFGPMARRVGDLALGLAVMAGEDPRDPFTHPFPLRNWQDVDPRTLRIAYWTHQEGVTAWSPTPETIETVENAAAALRQRVDKIVKTGPPVDIREHFQCTLAMYFDDGWQTLERLATRYGALDDDLVQQCIAIAREWRSEQTDEHVEHLKERWLHLRRQIRASLDGYDAVLTPVTCSPALPHGASYRPAMERLEYMHPAGDSFHIYEINVDGSGLRQLTHGHFHDAWPVYLPDGRIAFVSTRVESYSMCQDAPASALHVMEPDGSDIRRIQFGTLADLSPHVLDDGSILFTRWEYQDKSVFSIQSLWTINPDGTRLNLFYGNTITIPNTIWQARPIPGSRKVLCTLAPHHNNPVGAIGILDRHLGLENPRALRNLTPEIPYEATTDPDWGPGDRLFPWSYRDPYPIDRDLFLVSHGSERLQRYRLYLLDRHGDKALLHEDAHFSCFNPIPLLPRRHSHRVPLHEPTADDHGSFLLVDVYQGLSEVPRGSVKRLRVMSTEPKPTNNRGARAYYHGHDIVDPVIGAGTFYVKHHLGSVPVEADGSAHFRAPAGRELYFQALDDQGRELDEKPRMDMPGGVPVPYEQDFGRLYRGGGR